MKLCLPVALFAVAALTAQDRQAGQGINVYSREKEAALGAQLAQDVRRQHTVIDNPAIRDYVLSIGRRIAGQLPDPTPVYTFEVIAGDAGGSTHEPSSLPGGFIFVPATLFTAARDETEFAGMLAHAMAHVAERHGTRLASSGQIARMATIPLIFMGGWQSMGPGQDKILVPRGYLTIQRGFETEADALAVKILSGAGFDPTGLVRYVGRLQPKDANKLYSPLPPRSERIAALEKAIGQLPPGTYSPGGEFKQIQEEVLRLMPTPVRGPPSLVRPDPSPSPQ